MSINIDNIVENLQKDLLPLKDEYKNSLLSDKHLDENFSNNFLGYYHNHKCQIIYELKVNGVFSEYIQKYQGKVDLINNLEFKDLHFNSIYKTHDFLEAI